MLYNIKTRRLIKKFISAFFISFSIHVLPPDFVNYLAISDFFINFAVANPKAIRAALSISCMFLVPDPPCDGKY